MRGLTRLELALGDVAPAADRVNPQICGVWVGPRGACATDRYIIIQVARDSAGPSQDGGQPVFIPQDVARQALKAAPPLGRWDRPEEKVVARCTAEGRQVRLEIEGGAVLTRQAGVDSAFLLGPAFQSIVGKDGEEAPVAAVSVSAKVLAKLVNYLRAAFKSVDGLAVTFYVFEDKPAYYFRISSIHDAAPLGARVDGLVAKVTPPEAQVYTPPVPVMD